MASSINFFSSDLLFLMKPIGAEINPSDEAPVSRFINSMFFVPPGDEVSDEIDEDKIGASIRSSLFLNLFTKTIEENDVSKRTTSPDSIESMSQISTQSEESEEEIGAEVTFSNSKMPAANRPSKKSLERVKDIIQERYEPEVHLRYLEALKSDKVLNRHKLMLLALFKHKLTQ
jgi:hypothetical protein